MLSELDDLVQFEAVGVWGGLKLAWGKDSCLRFWQGTSVNGTELKESFTERLSERHVQNVTDWALEKTEL